MEAKKTANLCHLLTGFFIEPELTEEKRCQERVKKCVSRSGEWKWQSRKASESLGVRLSAEDVACDRLYHY
jgi:hypothetical protein